MGISAASSSSRLRAGAGSPDPLAEVLAGLTDLPESLSERLGALLDEQDRATAIRELFEELTRD